MNRRGFLKGILALGVAPAYVKSESLMGLYVPKYDGIFTLSDDNLDDLNDWWNGYEPCGGYLRGTQTNDDVMVRISELVVRDWRCTLEKNITDTIIRTSGSGELIHTSWK